MKKYFFVILLSFLFTQMAKAQDDIQLKKEDVVGRWIETKRIEGQSEKAIAEFADTYIFRDNGVFHKGEAAEGVILFNITGRYTIEGDSVEILYKDYIQNGASKSPAKKLIFKVLSLTDNEMVVSVIDYDFEYKMILAK